MCSNYPVKYYLSTCKTAFYKHRKTFYFVPFFVIQNNTSNSCLTDVLTIHFDYNMIFLLNNTKIFEEIGPTNCIKILGGAQITWDAQITPTYPMTKTETKTFY